MTESILLVEDEYVLNEVYSFILSTRGYKVYRTYNGAEALRLLYRIRPSLILLDIKMPKIDGLKFLKLLRTRSHNLQQLPKIIVFSNSDVQSDIQEAYTLGVDRCILKALITPTELLNMVEYTIHPIRKK